MRWIGRVGLMTGVLMAGIKGVRAEVDPLTILDRPAAATQQANTGREGQEQKVAGFGGRRLEGREVEALATRLTQKDMVTAVEKASGYLLKRLGEVVPAKVGTALPEVDQREWMSFAGDQRVGVVALMVEALLEAGRITGDPRLHFSSKELAPALTYLSKARSGQTYSTALQAKALSLLPPRAEYRAALGRARNDLAGALREDGSYGYALDRAGMWDNSNTQFAVLGMWAAAEAGQEIPVRFWKAEGEHWRRTQAANGGWGYRETVRDFKLDAGASKLSMPSATLTAAGVASMMVISDQMMKLTQEDERSIAAGMAKMAGDVRENPDMLSENLYYGYAIERVGVASGRKSFGGVDWYRRGAAGLILRQEENGSWDYAGELPGTALGILFLTHGGAPIAFNVLEYGSEGQWDPHPRAAAKLTRWMGRTLERRLNWQIVSADADVGEWMDAPVLMINGTKAPTLSEKQKAKLREYVQRGGMVWSMGEGEVGRAMKSLAEEIIGRKYDMRKLPAEHLALNFSGTRVKAELWSVSNGVRELWVHSGDAAETWQELAYTRADDWQLGIGIMMYATGQEKARDRLEKLEVPSGAKVRRQLTLARVKYEGNDDPEPAAWMRFGEMMARDAGVSVKTEEVEMTRLDAAGTRVAYVTGTGKFLPTEAEKAGLKAFLKEGGVLIGDAAGGSEEFSSSFRGVMSEITGQEIAGLVREDSAMFSGAVEGGVKLEEPKYRRGTPRERRSGTKVPEIWTWKVGEREAVYFSPVDVTAGLLGTETGGIAGYRPADALAVARDILMYAVSQSERGRKR